MAFGFVSFVFMYLSPTDAPCNFHWHRISFHVWMQTATQFCSSSLFVVQKMSLFIRVVSEWVARVGGCLYPCWIWSVLVVRCASCPREAVFVCACRKALLLRWCILFGAIYHECVGFRTSTNHVSTISVKCALRSRWHRTEMEQIVKARWYISVPIYVCMDCVYCSYSHRSKANAEVVHARSSAVTADAADQH